MSTPGDADHPQQPQQDPGQPQGQPSGQPQPPYGQPPYGQLPHGQGQPPYGQNPYQPAYGAPRPAGVDDGFWAPAAHWGALVTGLVTSGMLAFVAPLLVMQTKGQSSPVVRRHAVASLNFQLSLLIYAVVSGLVTLVGFVLSFVLVGIPILIVGALALLALLVASIVLPVVAAVKAGNGEEYTYPFAITLVS